MYQQSEFSEIAILALAFFTSLFFTLLLTPIAERVSARLGFVDQPCTRKVHDQCMSRLGGAAMAIAFFSGVVVFAGWGRELWAVLAGASIIFCAGLADDGKDLSPKLKFFFQIVAVVCFMLVGGVYLTDLGDIIGSGPIILGWAGPLLTVFAMTGVINSFNLSDGLDGLAAGMAAIACLFFIPFAYAQGNWAYMAILVCLMGVILGFLRFNTHPAKLFMGDSGSLLLGFVMAAAAVFLTQAGPAEKGYQPVTALIIVSLPVADTLFVMVRRIMKGQSPVNPDRTHIHHRLMAIGFSHQLTVSGIYCFMLGMGILAWTVRPLPEWVQFYTVLFVYFCLYAAIYFAERRTVSQNKQVGFNLRLDPTNQFLRKVLFWTAEKSWLFFIFIWASLLGCALLAPEMPAPFKYYILFVVLFGLVYYPWKGGIKQMGIAHAVIFFGLYSFILAINVASAGDDWMRGILLLVSGAAMLWTLGRVLNTRRVRVLWPGSLEVLLLGVALAVPVLVHYSAFMGFDFRWQMFISFLQTVPIFMLNKVRLRRNPARIAQFAGLTGLALVMLLF
ncbi:glycosyltransferase family 4 protein [Desulfonatronovibrio magnus]|uniref:glycosyltransferase family 4 protein n=1 Tax=Desulfonatronovibrio magnus TaxID=698827 RepID=UPI000697A74F|nr:MraY family glycosyltransferase [Desulfonatronovibrio magnus]